MKRKVKCVDTGEYSTNDVAYKGRDNRWYSSQSAYETILASRERFKKIYSLLQDILSISNTDPVPPVIIKAISKYKNRYDIVEEVLAQNMQSVREAIKYKEITDPFQQSRYILAVIENNYSRIKEEMQQLIELNRQRNIEAPSDISDLGRKNKSRDVSRLVGGFSWT